MLAWLRGAGGVTGRLRQRTLGGVLAPVAGQQVAILVGELRDRGESSELRYPSSGPQVVTGAAGRWSYLLPPDRELRYVGARTIDAPRAWVDEAVTVPAAP